MPATSLHSRAWRKALWAHFIDALVGILTTRSIFLSCVTQVADMLGELSAALQWATKVGS